MFLLLGPTKLAQNIDTVGLVPGVIPQPIQRGTPVNPSHSNGLGVKRSFGAGWIFILPPSSFRLQLRPRPLVRQHACGLQPSAVVLEFGDSKLAVTQATWHPMVTRVRDAGRKRLGHQYRCGGSLGRDLMSRRGHQGSSAKRVSLNDDFGEGTRSRGRRRRRRSFRLRDKKRQCDTGGDANRKNPKDVFIQVITLPMEVNNPTTDRP
jgi:hypothetical protein